MPSTSALAPFAIARHPSRPKFVVADVDTLLFATVKVTDGHAPARSDTWPFTRASFERSARLLVLELVGVGDAAGSVDTISRLLPHAIVATIAAAINARDTATAARV